MTTLNLEYNKIGKEGAIALAAALPNSQVTTLDLEAQLHRQGGGNRPCRCSLKLSSDNASSFGSNIGDEGASALAAALPNSQVTTLYLGVNKIGEDGAIALAAALPNSKVTTLELGAT